LPCEILAALKALPAARNCQTLIETANRTANEIMNKYQAVSEAYDRRTEHGRRDGAALI
jgi:predicted secreted Zn-dependent protease